MFLGFNMHCTGRVSFLSFLSRTGPCSTAYKSYESPSPRSRQLAGFRELYAGALEVSPVFMICWSQ